MDKNERKALVGQLKRRGFDKTTSGVYDGLGLVRPRCSQCEALCISGLACHETGCPNARAKRRIRR